MNRVACCLLVITAVAAPIAATPTANPLDGTDARMPGTGTAAETTVSDETVIASDGAFAGFTLGAAVLAVVVAGTYRYLRN